MQGTAHVIVNGEKILILWRLSKKKHDWGRAVKIRKSGKDGMFLTDESNFLTERQDLVEKIKNGIIVYI